MKISCHDNLNIVVVLSCIASYFYAFLCLRSLRVCVHARVFVQAYESRKELHSCL